MLPGPGSAFGSYDVGERIGRGGMGVVYRAVHRDLEREVALKVLSEQFSADADYRARFLSEARTLARLDSPHVVTIHDAGERDGSLYLAMQLVPDGDLSAWLRQYGAMPPAMALDLLRQVAEGLAAAHEAGVLHRDIKSSNVLLRRLPDGSARAYLCDFGIAQVEDAGHTRTGGVVGTWSYLAPERHRGVPASVASDLYAVGCLLWVMLTGRTPYQASTEMEVALAHMNAPVPQLTERSPLDRGINDLLRQLMDKDPARRPASAAALLGVIDRASDPTARPNPPHGAPAAPPPSGGSTTPAPSRGDLPTRENTGPQPQPAGQGAGQGVGRGSGTGHGGRRSSGAGRGRWWLAGGLAGVLLVAGGVTAGILLLDDGDGDGDGPAEPRTTPIADVGFADDEEPGVVDAELTVAPCADDADGLRIGGLLPLTSAERTYGAPTTSGLGLAVSDINAAGGVLGSPVCHSVRESGDVDTPDQTDAGAAALVAEDMSVVVGPTSTGVAETVVPTFTEARVPQIAVGAAGADLSGISPYFFRTIGDTTTFDAAFANLAQENDAYTIAFVAQAGSEDQAAMLQRLYDATLTEMACIYGCPRNEDQRAVDADFTDDAAAVVASAADTVVVLTDPSSLFLDAYAPAKTGANVITVGAPFQLQVEGYPEFFATVSALVNGVDPSDGFRSRLDDWASLADTAELTHATLAAESYDAAVLAALAAVRGEATDGETIAANLRAVSGSDGGTECATFRRCAALLEAGHEVAYRGVAVEAPIDADHDVESARFSVLGYDESGRLITDPKDEISARKP